MLTLRLTLFSTIQLIIIWNHIFQTSSFVHPLPSGSRCTTHNRLPTNSAPNPTTIKTTTETASTPTTTLLKAIKTLPNTDESWYVKTEQFSQPFPIVKPHLEAHRLWVAKLRSEGVCITSGYRVDADGKPGGGGLMVFAATDYRAAEALVLLDPLVANGCVDWELNGWIPEVGDIELR